MAIGLEEKKSSLQTILIVLLAVSCLGALVFFALQSNFFKGKMQQSAPVDLNSQEIGVDFNFLESGVIEKLEGFPVFTSVAQVTSSDIGRPNPFIPYQTAAVKETTSTQVNNSSK
jgi:hypothetical protein